jgi:hypothetical protein
MPKGERIVINTFPLIALIAAFENLTVLRGIRLSPTVINFALKESGED